MEKSFVKSLQEFIEKRRGVEQQTRELVERLNKVLPDLGYRLVPAATSHGDTPRVGSAVKRLECPECKRRFAHPLHLGRHLSATHGRKKRAGTMARRTAA